MDADSSAETTEEVGTAEDRPETLDEALGSGELISDIEANLGADQSASDASDVEVSPLQYDDLAGDAAPTGDSVRDLGLIADVDVEVSVEFGRTDIPIRQLLQLQRGSLVELHRPPEAQVTVLANGRPIALGDIVVVDGQVGVHIVELIDPEQPAEPAPPPATVVLGDSVAETLGGGDDAADDTEEAAD